MHADTDAIRGYGTATADLGANFHAAVSPLSSLPIATVTNAFGPVGARFARALAGATDALVTSLTRIGDDVVAAGTATTATAADFDDTERRSQMRVARLET